MWTLTHSLEGLQEHYYRVILAANLPYKISTINIQKKRFYRLLCKCLHYN